MSGYKHNQLKSKSYDEIQEMFDKEMKRVNTFVDMNTELVKSSETRTEGSSKRARDELESDNSKKSSKRYLSMIKMLQNIDREDLETLWKLVKAKHGNTRPEDEYERVLWGDMKRTVGETEQEYEPTTAEEKQDRRNEMKARGTLLMALPNKDQLKFHSYKEQKLLKKAMREYGGTRNPRKFKELYSSNNRELLGRIKFRDNTQTFDSCKNLSLSIGDSSTNEADNTAYGVSATYTQSNPTTGDNLSDVVICAFLASQPNSPQMSREDLEQINPDDLEEMDLQWEMAMLTIKARRFIKRTDRQLDVNGQKGMNWTTKDEEEYLQNFALMAHTSLGSSSSSDSETVLRSNLESAGVKSNGDAVEPKTVSKNSFRPPVIEDWNSDDESEVEIIPNVKDKTVRPSTEKIKFIKTAKGT
ncbi:hypothetical protein Tco_0975250 [Tanacetum coccineum]|uniref:Uncharacterized protein n=1 Tax=Tanacetum coccineum TaxID=301880 RepID=A0ABQ5EDW0_9ASTR